eukprot:gnl/TRDRNA2_/TRDRNA2_192891_c0_seq1.p1 gnl/TRDRNA2_/TRDRNA2_192891_c0~~gnl/TRDRNA2_/TRDRNA2_192891_c0_seq1.p1  ORF type:complete len:606 (-),score=142.19 gnl/TRDRNA2_/TRDRNA2_192891_c0_seq1:37-1665(-)
MSAVLQMAAAGMANGSMTTPGMGGGPLMPPMDPVAATPGLGLGQDPGAAAAAEAAMAQAFAFAQFMQQAQAFAAAGGDPSAQMGMQVPPPAPFPPMMPYSQLSGPAVIMVSVEGMKFQYQLTEDDLQKVFSRYGVVTKIELDTAGTSASIAFDSAGQAQAAMQDLHGKVLNGLDGTLRISWAPGSGPAGPAMPPPYPMMPPPFPGWGFGPAAPATPWAMPNAGMTMPTEQPPATCLPNGTTPAAPNPLGSHTPSKDYDQSVSDSILAAGEANNFSSPAHVKGVRKYTCRFLIGIENDKEFQVVRRVIGAKGANMKKIVKATEAKLRLRGVGSGYFEGAGQRESAEPLQLCVSCTTSEGYRTAVRMVEELLEGVYTEYRQFCRENGRPEPDLHVVPQPQLVASSKDRMQQSPFGRATPGSPPTPSTRTPGGVDDDLEEDGDEDENQSPGGGETGSPGARRRRGRRSRAKRGAQNESSDPPPRAPPVEDIQRMIDQRNEARRQCNFAEADKLRQELHERGVALMDEPGGRGKGSEVTTWRYWRD